MKPSQINHPGTPKVICSISVAIVISLVLTTSMAQGAYTPLKYLLSFALLYSSGFFLMPRRRVLILHPDNASDMVSAARLQKTYAKVGDWSGWVEIDRLTGESVYWTTRDSIPFADDKIMRLALKAASKIPISTNTSITLALLAIFFNPLAGISLQKIDWIFADITLAIYLMFTLGIVLKEKKSPRYEIIDCDKSGVFSNIDGDIGSEALGGRHPDVIIRCVIRYWPALVVFIILMTAFALNASKSLPISEFVLIGVLLAATINVVGTYILGFLIVNGVHVCWLARPCRRFEYCLAIFCALFIVFATSEAAKIARRHNDPPSSRGLPF
jgi:hypothetical protein